jgi:hypothetical protein
MILQNLNIIDTNTGIKYTLESTGNNEVKVKRLYYRKKSKRRSPVDITYFKCQCEHFIKNGTWLVIQ